MEDLKTRFNNMKYEHFRVKFKGVMIEVKLLDDNAIFPNSVEKRNVEEFKVILTYKDKSIDYKFYNSIMEREISQFIKNNRVKGFQNQNIKVLKQHVFKFWSGYDDCNNIKALIEKRIFYLLYSILNTLSLDISMDLSSFSWFCSNFGYDEDSRNAERIYKECQLIQEKLNSLNFDEDFLKYLEEEAGQETDKFHKDVLDAIKKEVI